MEGRICLVCKQHFLERVDVVVLLLRLQFFRCGLNGLLVCFCEGVLPEPAALPTHARTSVFASNAKGGVCQRRPIKHCCIWSDILSVKKLSDFENQYRGQTHTSRALTLTYKNVWVYGHVVKEYVTPFDVYDFKDGGPQRYTCTPLKKSDDFLQDRFCSCCASGEYPEHIR